MKADKLELKHIAGYLPYGLKMMSQNDFVSPLIRDLRVDGFQFMIDTRKPILRPISDLIKEIEVNGYKFIPMHFWDDKKRIELLQNCSTDYTYCEYLEHFIFEELYKWYFDVHGLIPAGLAIDINSLNKNA